MKPVQRLTGRRRFEALRIQGRSARGAWVRVRALVTGSGCARAAVGVRGSRSAVERNRARRRLRAALREVLPRHGGVDVLVTVSASDATRTAFAMLRDDLATAIAVAVRGGA